MTTTVPQGYRRSLFSGELVPIEASVQDLSALYQTPPASPLATATMASPLSLATSQTSAEPVTSALSTLTPTADVSLTPSGTGNLAPTGSEAYRSAIGQGGIGLDAMNQNILNYLATNPTEVAAFNEAKKYGVSQEDIERATGKTYEQIFPETFRPGSVLSSGFGDVTKQLEGSGYYKGVAVPTFNEIYDTEQGPGKSVAQQLADWKAGIDAQDLTAKAPFGFVETPVYTQPTGDYDPYVSGYQATPATAFDYLTKNNPVIASAFGGHTSTGAYAYKVVNGQLQEVGHDQITPEDIAQGNAFFMLAGKTGGADRERMSQLYRAEGDNLIPVGDPKLYKGAPKQDTGMMFLDMAASALSFVPGPWQVPAMVYKAARAADQGDWSGVAKIFLPGPIATAVDIYEAIDSKDPFRIANSLMQSNLLPSMGGQKIPGTDFTVNDGIKAARIVNAVSGDQKDFATAIQLAGELSNSPNAALAGKGLKVVQAFESGNMNAAFNAAMDLGKTADKLTNVKVPATNADAAARAFVDANLGSSKTDTTSALDRAAFLDANAAPQGVGALSTIPAEDEQIALAQLNQDATSLVNDYVAAGGSMEPTDLAAALSNLKDPYGRPLQTSEIDRLVGQAQTQLDTQTRNAKTQSDTLAVLSDYTGRDSDLSRENAYMRLVAAGNSGERADEILNSVDTQVEANRAARAATLAQNQAAINAGAGEFEGADTRAAVTAGAGEFTGADKAAAVNARISNATSFNDAYAIARQEFGPNSTFNYQGKLYSTATAEERPDLSAAGLAAKALSGDPQFQVALSEKAVQNQRDISQVFSDYSQKGGDLTREGALSRLESLGVTKDQASFYLDQADGKLPLLYDQFKAKVPTGSEDSYRAYILAFNELKNKGVPTSLIDVSGYGASGARPNMPAAINAISTAFGMGAEAAGNALKAFGTVGESFGFNTAQMSDYGRRLENIAQELYPQALTVSEDEVKGRFANAKTPKELGQAVMDSVLNNPGALLKMGGVELIQEAPNIALALATGGTSALIRYGGLLAGLGLDVVESAGLQGAQKVDEGLAKGLTRTQAVKSAVDDMKAAGAVTAIMTAAADRVPFGGTVAKTLIKGSAGEGTEEYLIARATGQDHMSALRQAAFGALIGGPTEASLQGAGNLTNVTINGDTMIGTYEDGTKVSISEPSGATDLKIDILKPSDVSVNVSNTLTGDLTAGLDLTTSINNAVSNNITADLGGTIDSTIKAVVDNGADLSQGVTDLTSSAVSNTGDTTAVINNVVSSLASNGTDLNANAGSVVAGAVSGGATVTDAVDTTLKAVTANGGNVADSAASIVTTVSTQSGGDTTKVADATTAVVDAAITSGTNITTATSNAVDAALAASGGSTDVVTQVVGDIASKGNNDATAAAVASAVTNTGNTTAAVDAALSSGGDAGTVLSTASNAAVTAGTDAGTAVTNTLSSALSNNVDTKVAVDSTIKGALDAGADVSTVVDSAITTSLDSGVDTTAAVTSVITSALNNNADTASVIDSTVTAAITSGADTASVIDSTVTAAITSGADTGSVVDSTIKAAVTAGTDSTTAIDSTLTAVANAGGDVSQAAGFAVDASLAAGADTSQTLIAATSTAITNGGDASTVVSNVVNSAVNNGTSLADASASSVATAIVSGANADTVIKAVTDSNSGLAVESGSEGGVTTVVASDGTSNTQVSMDANTQTVTTTTTDTSTGETKQVTISGDTTTTVTTDNSGVTKSVTVDEASGTTTQVVSDASGTVTSVTTDNSGATTEVKSDATTGVVTQIVSNPDRDQIVTTTWNADNTVTVTTKSGDGPEATETLTADVAPVKPKLDPIAAVVPVQAVQATKTTAPKAAAPKASFKLPSAAASGFGLSMPMASSDYDLGVLKSSGDTRIKNPLEALMERIEQMNQIDPTLAAVMSQRLGIQPQQAPTFTYGQETSIDDILGLREPKKPEMEEALYAEGGYVEPLRAKGGAMNLQFMDRGGALPGGREDFKGGKHVAGDGDGQSDDIPAWLADGEFVFPADVVSALGNGSTKAGTDKLYKMMHEIRARARSTKVKDLPPPAHKSPLDYIKKGK